MSFVLDRHLLALILLGGQMLDLFGGLYLAYELFGGPNGPLRRLTHLATYFTGTILVTVIGYLVLFVVVVTLDQHTVNLVGYQTLLGGTLGLGIGSGIGGGLGYAFNATRRQEYQYPSGFVRVLTGLVVGAIMGVLLAANEAAAAITVPLSPSFAQALVFGLAVNLINGFVFGALVAWLLMKRYPHAADGPRPGFDWFGFITGFLVGLAISAVHAFGYWLTLGPSITSAVVFGIAGGAEAGSGIGLFMTVVNDIGWRIDHAPPNLLGRVGIILIIAGFLIQSMQYLVPLFDVPVR